MYKKLFGFALIAHILVFAYISLRPGNDEAPIGPPAESETASFPTAENKRLPESGEDDFLEEVTAMAEVTLVREFPKPKFEVLPATIRSDDLGAGLLYDITNGTVLWERESDTPVRIASMTKMITALIAFEDVASKDDVSLDVVIPVSKAAAGIGGSQVWLDPRESFTLEELLISIMIKSANDSSYLVGEYLADGDMRLFIQQMNDRAAELLMTETHFFNAHGLPEGNTGNTASCQDLARLAIALIRFDLAIEWASMPTYDFRSNSEKPTILTNHNRLIQTTEGVDGLKTGYTKGAGFCVTATCLRNGRRLIAVTTGFKSSKRRDAFTKELINWGYTQDK